jgi:D-alanyl-D-alanine carboxypeptidase
LIVEGLTERLRLAGLALTKSFAGAAVIGFLWMAPSAEARYASIIIDGDTGQVLQEVNADDSNYPASLTKMMTLYLAFEALKDGRLKLDQDLVTSFAILSSLSSPNRPTMRRRSSPSILPAARAPSPSA